MGFVALLELDEDSLVVLVFEVEHLLIEMTDRHVYIFTVLIERYRIFPRRASISLTEPSAAPTSSSSVPLKSQIISE